MLPVPDQAADIEFIVENAGAPPPVAVDGRGTPGITGGTGDRLPVEGVCNSFWGTTLRELLEDPAYNLSLELIDTAFAAHRFACSINLVNNVITKAQTTP